MDGFEYLEAPEGGYLDREGVEDAYGGGYLEGFEQLRFSEDNAGDDGTGCGGGLPDGVKWGVRYKSLVINSPVYCAYLLRRFVLRGGRTREYTLAEPREAFHLAENVRTVVNCSGMGFGDPKSFIIRGACTPYTVTLTTYMFQLTNYYYFRPNMPRPKPLLNNPYPPTRRRSLVLLHPPAPRRRYHHRGHQRTAQLGSRTMSRDQSAASRPCSQVVSFHRGK